MLAKTSSLNKGFCPLYLYPSQSAPITARLRIGERVNTRDVPVQFISKGDGKPQTWIQAVTGEWLLASTQAITYFVRAPPKGKQDEALEIVAPDSALTHYAVQLEGSTVPEDALISAFTELITSVTIVLRRSVHLVSDAGLRAALQRNAMLAVTHDYRFSAEFSVIAKSGILGEIQRIQTTQFYRQENDSNVPTESSASTVKGLDVVSNVAPHEPEVPSRTIATLGGHDSAQLYSAPSAKSLIGETVCGTGPNWVHVSNISGDFAQLANHHGNTAGKWIRHTNRDAGQVLFKFHDSPLTNKWIARAVQMAAVPSDMFAELPAMAGSDSKLSPPGADYAFPWPKEADGTQHVPWQVDTPANLSTCYASAKHLGAIVMVEVVPYIVDEPEERPAEAAKPVKTQKKFNTTKLFAIRRIRTDGILVAALNLVLKRSMRQYSESAFLRSQEFNPARALCNQTFDCVMTMFADTLSEMQLGADDMRVDDAGTAIGGELAVPGLRVLCPHAVNGSTVNDGGLICVDISSLPAPSWSLGFWAWVGDLEPENEVIFMSTRTCYPDEDEDGTDQEHERFFDISLGGQDGHELTVNTSRGAQVSAVIPASCRGRKWVHISVGFRYAPTVVTVSDVRLVVADASGQVATTTKWCPFNEGDLKSHQTPHISAPLRLFPKSSAASSLVYSVLAVPTAEMDFRRVGVPAPPAISGLARGGNVFAKDFTGEANRGKIRKKRDNHWDPDQCDKVHTLSNDNMTVSNVSDSGKNHIIRAKYGYKTGLHYWQVKVDSYSGSGNGYHWIGVATATATKVNNSGSPGKEFWGIYTNGNNKIGGGSGRQSYGKFSHGNGSTYGIVLDLVERTVGFCSNGTYHGVAFSNLPDGEEFFPCVGVGALKKNVYTVNFDCADKSPVELIPERGGGGGADSSVISDAYSTRLAQQLGLISDIVDINARVGAGQCVLRPSESKELYARLRALIAAQQGNSANALVRLSAISTCFQVHQLQQQQDKAAHDIVTEVFGALSARYLYLCVRAYRCSPFLHVDGSNYETGANSRELTDWGAHSR